MSYALLRDALLRMKAAGGEGFEGLTASLLSSLTGDRFFVARSGEQPADATAETTGVAIQAKRYARTPLDETEFEGDYGKACRLLPTLDTYVLAATRETAQLRALARELEEVHGVDILFVGFGEDELELAELCVTFWDAARCFAPLAGLPPSLDDWAASEAARPEVQATIERLLHALKHSVNTAEVVRRRLSTYCQHRFGIAADDSRPNRYTIDLPSFVVREEPRRALDAWWADKSKRAALLQAEEGMGKSWVAADFGRRVVEESGALTVWMDSADWSEQPSLSAIVAHALRLAGITEEKTLHRLARKALRRWSHRLLVILDGINERGAKASAHRLLAELFAPGEASCRLLFTTRPIAWPADERALWRNTSTIEIDRFTEAELGKSLHRLNPPIPRSELPEGLVETARIPRYFQRTLALRERFRSLVNVSKEMVLWADLLAKIEAHDAQLTGSLFWTSQADAKRALLKLARGARALQGANPASAGYELLLSVFGNRYHDVRHDLADQRIVLDPTGDYPRPSPEHVRLGFALHLGQFLRGRTEPDVEVLADMVRAELEPVLSQDEVTEALFVALQLSVFSPAGPDRLDHRQRAGLLLAWGTAHNARVEPARLHFWAGEDEAAYLAFLEAACITPVSESWLRALIQPLIIAWRAAPEPSSPLAQKLHRWLQLVWVEPSATALTHCVVDGHEFPLARTQAQLVLSNIAVNILSEGDLSAEILPDLVLAWMSDDISRERHRVPGRNGEPEQTIMLPCKEICRNLGPLFRWRYTEAIKPALIALQEERHEDQLVRTGCTEILAAFDQFGWRRVRAPEQELRAGKDLFPSGQSDRRRFVECPHLAVRDDLPELSVSDQEQFARRAEAAFASSDLHSDRSMTVADFEFRHCLAWFARYRPARLVELGSRFRLAALGRASPALALDCANTLPYSPEFVSPRELLDAAIAMALREIGGEEQRTYWALAEAHVLALTCYPEQELGEWFEFSARHPHLRREIHLYPSPLLLPLLCPQALADRALRRALAADDAGNSRSGLPDTNFAYWATIAGTRCGPDAGANREIHDRIGAGLPPDGHRFYWLLLYFRTAPDEELERIFTSGEILPLLNLEGWRALRFSGREHPPWNRLPPDFDFVLQHAALDVCGTLLAAGVHTGNLKRWGRLLFAKAFELLGQQPPERTFWGKTIYQVGCGGEVVGTTCDQEDGPAPPPEGSFRPGRHDPGQVPRWTGQSAAQISAGRSEAIRLWHEDLERLEDLPAASLHQFGACGALAAFRDLNPERFRQLGVSLLSQVLAKPDKSFHLGAFVLSVASVLLPLEPNLAFGHAREIREGPFRSDVLTEYGASICDAALWRAARDGNTWCVELCRSVLRAAETDAELMRHAGTAVAEKAAGVLLSSCEAWLASPLAKERCLAVSLLPWLAEPAAMGRLEALAGGDVSGWVRTHAAWALEVARQELAARRLYSRILTQGNLADVQSLLEVLRPALLESAAWWRREIEEQAEPTEHLPPDVLAAVTLFWQGVESRRGSEPDVFGRKLKEHLRGEKISDIQPPGLRLS